VGLVESKTLKNELIVECIVLSWVESDLIKLDMEITFLDTCRNLNID
jgi:hypothetical protein